MSVGGGVVGGGVGVGWGGGGEGGGGGVGGGGVRDISPFLMTLLINWDAQVCIC